MAVKFFTGLGDVSAASTTAQMVGTTKGISVNTQGKKEDPRRESVDPDVKGGSDTSFISLEDQIEDVQETLYSSESVEAPFSMLFDDFDLKVEPVYNRYVAGEENDGGEKEWEKKSLNSSVSDLNRYIKLSWKTAPNLSRPADITPKSYGTRDINLAAIEGVVKGSDFVVKESIGSVKDMVVNPIIGSGMMDIKLEDPANDVGDVKTFAVDVGRFLTDDSTVGISLNQIKSNVAADSFSTTSKGAGYISSVLDGKASIKSATASSPAMSFKMSVPNKQQPVESSVMQISKTAALVGAEKIKPIAATLVDTGIVGVVEPKYVNIINSPHHAESVVAVAELATSLVGNLQRPKGRVVVPSIRTSQDVQTVQYIGYVVEKHEMTSDGTYRLVDTFNVDGRQTSEKIDALVSYGKMYRYRIATIVRVAKKLGEKNENVMTPSNGVFGTQDRSGASNLSSILTKECTYYQSHWSDWIYASVIDTVRPPPPDEVSVFTESMKKQVIVTWKLPYDSQGDFKSFRVLRKVSSDGVSGAWKVVADGLPPTNGCFIDTDVQTAQENGGSGYVYAVQLETVHRELSLLSDQIMCWLDSDYKAVGERPLEFVSEAGAELNATGPFVTKPPRRHTEEIETDGAVIFRPRTGKTTTELKTKSYQVVVESLETGQVARAAVEVSHDSAEQNMNVVTVNVDV